MYYNALILIEAAYRVKTNTFNNFCTCFVVGHK